MGSGPQEGRDQSTVCREGVQDVRCVCAELDSEHGTRHRQVEPREVVSHVHSRTRASTWTRTKNVTCTHRPSGWNRPRWGIRPLYFGDYEKQLYRRRRAGTRWVDLMAEHLEEQSFDRCDAAPQIFATFELDVFIEVHMDDLHGTGPRPALNLVQTNLSQKVRFKIWTVIEVGMNTNTSSVNECCTMKRLRSHPTQNT